MKQRPIETSPRLSILATNVKSAMDDTLIWSDDMFASAYRYRHELAALERRDAKPDADGNPPRMPWVEAIKIDTEAVAEGADEEAHIQETIKHYERTMDGVYVLCRAAMGQPLSKELKPWMLKGFLAREQRDLLLRQAGHDLETAFIEQILEMASFLLENAMLMAFDREHPDDQEALKEFNDMTLEDHLGQLIHRITKLSEIHAQWGGHLPLAEEYGYESEEYDLWLHKKIMARIKSKNLRSAMADAIKQQKSEIRKKCEEFDRISAEFDDEKQAEPGNVVKLNAEASDA